MNDNDSDFHTRNFLPARSAIAALLLGYAVLMPVAGICAQNVAQTVGGVTYVSGGVDDASLDALKGEVRNYNLKLVFALKTGEFMSDVKVAISDARGNPVLNATSDGPWFLAKLPAGSYRVVATSSGKPISQQASVDPAKLKTLDFRWASE
jgi:hypothetical protein